MKKDLNFWRSLEEYSWKVVGRTPLPKYWRWMVVALILTVLFMSIWGMRQSLVSAKSTRDAIMMASELGDYDTAKKLLNHYTNESTNHLVLGVESELEEMVYPERVLERKIVELEQKMDQYPGNREIYLALADLYGQLGNQEESSEYREKARILDPNGINF